ncbi:MAG: hypothetical protein A2Z04_00125 [Chloroflexi bacterium RBG_16_57_9]|nr:MAG: hypothetical protein A2Z04_00125 [Chloroflexi bacterium RBG_16_57_9]
MKAGERVQQPVQRRVAPERQNKSKQCQSRQQSHGAPPNEEDGEECQEQRQHAEVDRGFPAVPERPVDATFAEEVREE